MSAPWFSLRGRIRRVTRAANEFSLSKREWEQAEAVAEHDEWCFVACPHPTPPKPANSQEEPAA